MFLDGAVASNGERKKKKQICVCMYDMIFTRSRLCCCNYYV